MKNKVMKNILMIMLSSTILMGSALRFHLPVQMRSRWQNPSVLLMTT